MRTLMAQSFTCEQVTPLRRSVAQQAYGCGLAGARLEDYLLAVHESVINAVLHGGGKGHFTLWTADGLLRSETIDHGSGIPGHYVDDHRLPSDHSFGGRGIYLICRLCDGADFRTGPAGTTVQLTMRLPAPAGLSLAGRMRRVRVSACDDDRRFERFIA
jgi:serine/threonine-protein kinase RsbW